MRINNIERYFIMALWNVGGGIKHYKHLVAMNDNAK